ncbi:hypothetical protein ASC87_14350 [Rhizobacter sp. Root1221]|nr:hypothetical protein ASC87_14350 [Rhizobacter sp. Root1221]
MVAGLGKVAVVYGAGNDRQINFQTLPQHPSIADLEIICCLAEKQQRFAASRDRSLQDISSKKRIVPANAQHKVAGILWQCGKLRIDVFRS